MPIAEPFFADLVRETSVTTGTGALTLAGAVPGHRSFAGTVPVGSGFFYAIAGITRPDEWEVGEGSLSAAGLLNRDVVLASSQGGMRVDFAAGVKTAALTIAADWFAGRMAEEGDVAAALMQQAGLLTAQAAELAGKQPLSTGHAAAALFAPTDTVTVRRAAEWVNVPLSGTILKQAAGGYFADAPLGIGTASPLTRLHCVLASGANITLSTGTSTSDCSQGIDFRDRVTGGGPGQLGGRIHCRRNGTGASYQLRFATGAAQADAIDRWYIVETGHLRPVADNIYAIGSAAERVSVIFAATGTINTSDARDKAWRGGLNAAEQAAAAAIAREIGVYQWNDSIAEKGEDEARLHIGVRAQAVAKALSDAGLETMPKGRAKGDFRHALLCVDRAEGADRWGVRSDQLMMLMIAAQEARIAALEARLDSAAAAGATP